MEYPSEDHASFIVLPHTFSAVRVYENSEGMTDIAAIRISLKFSCSTIVDISDGGMKAVIGFQRLRAWLGAVLNDIIIIDIKSPILPTFRENVSNIMMYTPGDVDDALLVKLFHSKASAITNDLLNIYTIWLSSTDTENTERYFRCEDGNYDLPGIEYYNDVNTEDEITARNKRPWWERPTMDICEYGKADDDKVIMFEFDPLLEIGKEYLTGNTEADIIVFDNWKKNKE